MTIPTVIPANKSSKKEYLFGKLKILFNIFYKLQIDFVFGSFFITTRNLILTKSSIKLINRFKISDEISLIKIIFFRFGNKYLMRMENVECLIIGSGPAGYTAAIYAARADLNPVVYTGMEPGGQLTTTTDVDNFPGYPDGIEGPIMMKELQKQAERFGTDVRIGHITQVKLNSEKGKMHTVTIDKDKTIQAKTIIISTGASAKYLGLPSEQRLIGGGVSACAVCDGFFFKNQEVAIVGGGDTAAEEATYLAKICSKVTMIVRKNKMRASKAMQHRVNKTNNIEILYETEISEVLGEKVVEGIEVINNKTQLKSKIYLSGLFIAIGHKPNTEIFRGQVEMDDLGYILTKGKSTKTNKPGVFASGDVQDKEYRQAVTAAGTGCMAALDAERYIGTLN